MRNRKYIYTFATIVCVIALALSFFHVASALLLLLVAYVISKLLLIWYTRKLRLPESAPVARNLKLQRVSALLVIGVAVAHLLHWPFASQFLMLAMGYNLWAHSRYLAKLEQQFRLEHSL